MSSNAVWIILALVAIFAVAILGRRRAGRPSLRWQAPLPAPEPLRPGESYDNSVKLATVPNMPFADMWCQRLREEGIEAFYKPSPYSLGGPLYAGVAGANPGLPVELWVGEHSVGRARELFPELA
jgi:hypothetical protein